MEIYPQQKTVFNRKKMPKSGQFENQNFEFFNPENVQRERIRESYQHEIQVNKSDSNEMKNKDKNTENMCDPIKNNSQENSYRAG